MGAPNKVIIDLGRRVPPGERDQFRRAARASSPRGGDLGNLALRDGGLRQPRR
jgi:hypothetical protein